MKAVFLDRDGTLIVDPPDVCVSSVEKIQLFPDTIEALRLLATLDYEVFIVSNQAGIAEGKISKQQFEIINGRVLELLAPSEIKIVQTYVCPHSQADKCVCRKPQPTMLNWAAEDYNLDLSQSWMVGDRQTDVTAGIAAGAKTILVQTGSTLGESADATYTAPTLLDAITFIQSQTNH